MSSTPPPTPRLSPTSKPPPPRPFFRSHSSSAFYRPSSSSYRSSPSIKMPKVLKPLHKKEKEEKKIEKKEKKMERKAEKMERKAEKMEKKLEKKRHHHHHHHHHHRRTTTTSRTTTTAAATTTATTTTTTATTKRVVKSSVGGSERKESSSGKTPATATTTTTTSPSIYPTLPLPSAPSSPPPSVPPFTLPTIPPPPILPPPTLDPDLSDLLCCPICMEEYTPGGDEGCGGDPLFLHCHHSLCRNCLPRLLRTHIGKGGKETVEVTCPECRVVTLVPSGGLTQNFYLVSLIEAKRKRPKEPGSRLRMWCEECDTVALDRCASHRLCHLSSVLARLTHTYTRTHTHTTALLQTKMREEGERVKDAKEAMQELEKSTSFLHSRLEEKLERSSLHVTTASSLLTEVQEMEKRVGILGRRRRGGGGVLDSPPSSSSSSSTSSSSCSSSSSPTNSLDLETQRGTEGEVERDQDVTESKDPTEHTHTETHRDTHSYDTQGTETGSGVQNETQTPSDLWKRSPYQRYSLAFDSHSPAIPNANAPQKSTALPKTREDRHSSGLETAAHLCNTKDTPSSRPQRHSTGLETSDFLCNTSTHENITHRNISQDHKFFGDSRVLERCSSGPDWYTDGEQKYSCGLGRSNSSPEKERNATERKLNGTQKYGLVAEISGSGLEGSTTSLGKYEKYLHRTETQRDKDATEKNERENLAGIQNLGGVEISSWAKRSELASGVQKFSFGTENLPGIQKLGLDAQESCIGATGVQILGIGAQKSEKSSFGTENSASESQKQNSALENLRYAQKSGFGTQIYMTQTLDGQSEPFTTQTLETEPQNLNIDAQTLDTDGFKYAAQMDTEIQKYAIPTTALHETLAAQTESDAQTLSSTLGGRETTEIFGPESRIETHINNIGSCDIENRIALLKACISSLKDMERKLEGMEGLEERREGGMEVNLDSLLQMFTKAVNVLGE